MRRTRTARPSPRRRRAPDGFTLLETALATVIIGVGVLAVVEAQQAFLQRNSWSTSASTAAYLAGEVREMAEILPRHDRFTGGVYFTDPVNLAGFTGWGLEAGETATADLDDLDDLDGAVFGNATSFPAGFTMTARYPGPINSLRETIPEVLWDGSVELFTAPGETEPSPVPMREWTQIVTVRKVDPYNITTELANNAQLMQGATILRAVDRYPLRVTVTAISQSDPSAPAVAVATTSWVVMP